MDFSNGLGACYVIPIHSTGKAFLTVVREACLCPEVYCSHQLCIRAGGMSGRRWQLRNWGNTNYRSAGVRHTFLALYLSTTLPLRATKGKVAASVFLCNGLRLSGRSPSFSPWLLCRRDQMIYPERLDGSRNTKAWSFPHLFEFNWGVVLNQKVNSYSQ